jgi:hypothetical protein
VAFWKETAKHIGLAGGDVLNSQFNKGIFVSWYRSHFYMSYLKLVSVYLIGSQPSRGRATFRTVLPGKVFFYVRTQSSSHSHAINDLYVVDLNPSLPLYPSINTSDYFYVRIQKMFAISAVMRAPTLISTVGMVGADRALILCWSGCTEVMLVVFFSGAT